MYFAKTPSIQPLWAALAASMALLASAANAAPRWEPVMLADQGMFYLDSASVVEQSDRKEVWTVLDYRKPQNTADGKVYLSTRAQVWINCRLQMGRIMHLTYYSGPMLGGKEIEKTGMLQDWQPIEAGTPVQKIARKLC
jgi:hypothetical protein